ncbi:adenine phosphoribosyltransferase-like [Clytia hemisphaerica]|uniref:Adenine phosphoribosyltransferase n=1 Tax=Clytia hemisphaerica TaxID=252671 RepID=A0A7M5WSD9_9CNID
MADIDWSDPEKSIEGIKKLIKAVPDFPKKGILFRDIMGIFQVPQAVQAMVDIMSYHIQQKHPECDAIVGLDARGFLMAPMIAIKLNVPFIPVRKQGKLPGECISAESVKEYGKDVLEMQKGCLKEGQKVVIVDDLLATGGTMATTCSLVRQFGCSVSGTICLVELAELNGVKKLDAPFHAMIKY